ncbi:MAG: hypothetical protein AAF393_04935 [Pseudomonadota bacterium]
MGHFSVHTKFMGDFMKTCRDAAVSTQTIAMLDATSKLDNAAKALDKARTGDQLNAALDTYAEHLVRYGNMVGARKSKESGAAKQAMMKAFTVMDRKAGAMLNDAQAKLAKFAATAQIAGAVAADAAGDKGIERNFKKALKEFEDRRKYHLSEAEYVFKACQKAAQDTDKKMKKVRLALKEAERSATNGAGDRARQFAEIADGLSQEATAFADEMMNLHTTRIRNQFQKDRNLGWTNLSKKYKLPNSLEDNFKSQQRGINEIFEAARDRGSAALKFVKKIENDAKQMVRMTAQAGTAANAGENSQALRESVLANWQSTGGNTARAQIENLITGPKGLERALERIQRPMENVVEHITLYGQNASNYNAAAYKTAIMSLKEKADSALEILERAKLRFASAVKNVPSNLMSDAEIKGALAEVQKSLTALEKQVVPTVRTANAQNRNLAQIVKEGAAGPSS